MFKSQEPKNEDAKRLKGRQATQGMRAAAAAIGAGMFLLAIGFLCEGEGYFKIQNAAVSNAPPQIVSVTGTNTVMLFSTNVSVTDGRVLSRIVQNVGTQPVLYGINVSNVSNTNYHGILSGGTANRDGKGAIVDLTKVIWPVGVAVESGTGTVSVIELTQ